MVQPSSMLPVQTDVQIVSKGGTQIANVNTPNMDSMLDRQNICQVFKINVNPTK